jgi:MFS family permease
MQIVKFFTQFRSYSQNIQSILTWNMIFCLGLGIHVVLYNLYLQSIVQDEVLVGKITGLNFLAQAIIYIPAGLLSDRIGAKKGLLSGISILIAALIGNLTASNAVELSFWGFMVGIGQAASIVMFVPLLTEYSNTNEKRDLFAFAFSTGTFFTFLGTLSGGIISDYISAILQLPQTSSIRFTLSLAIILFFICTVPLLLVKNKLGIKLEKNSQSLLVWIRKPYTLLPILKFSFSKMLAAFSFGIIGPFMNLFFLNKYDLSPSNISFILAAGTLITVFFMSYNSKVTRRFSEVRTVSLYHLLSIPAVLLLGFTHNLWIAVIAFILFRSANFGLGPIESKIMMETVDPEVRGLSNSIGFMMNSLCISMLGPLAMYLVQVAGNESGYKILSLISSTGSIAAAVYFFVVFGYKKIHVEKRLENTPA